MAGWMSYTMAKEKFLITISCLLRSYLLILFL